VGVIDDILLSESIITVFRKEKKGEEPMLLFK